MVHSSEWKVEGMAEKRADAIRTGRVEVRVVLWSLQARSKLRVVLNEKAREMTLLRVGGMILEPDQRLLGLGKPETDGVASGRRVSRLGRRGALGGWMMLLANRGGFDERAAWNPRWNTIPDAPSPRE